MQELLPNGVDELRGEAELELADMAYLRSLDEGLISGAGVGAAKYDRVGLASAGRRDLQQGRLEVGIYAAGDL